MKFTLTVEFDDEKATAYNASLYEGSIEDPVWGTGKTLVRGVIEECGIDEIVGHRGGLAPSVTSVAAELDGRQIEYPRGEEE